MRCVPPLGAAKAPFPLAYEVLKEFRGGFVAGFWQGVSRIFGQNLKSEYDKQNEDRMIEQIVIYYEAGLLR